MKEPAIDSTISSLKNVVTIVAGLAITNAIITVFVVNNVADFKRLTIDTSLLFFLFILNVIRFHHGNVRHLDTTYTSDPGKVAIVHKPVGASGKTALDFFVIFFQSVVFAVLSFLLKQPNSFFALFAALIAVDVLWYLAVHGMVTDKSRFLHQKRWSINNVATLLALLIVLAHSARIANSFHFYICFFLVLLNTVVDFAISWEFYFPAVRSHSSEE